MNLMDSKWNKVLNHRRFVLLIGAIILIILSWWGVVASRPGLVVRSLMDDQVPLLYLAPASDQAPGVLVAHGFAGSKQLMLAYGHVFAHAGYAVMLWDFDGHGANPNSLQRFDLQQNLSVALEALLKQPEVDPARLALLGHSMGSGVVMTAGLTNPDRFAATIAISPTGADVSPQAPRNLQLQAGSWEGAFVRNAERLLAEAGGPNANFAAGTARKLIIVPHVEHITILFSDTSHQAARQWLDATFNHTHSSRYVDRRMVWYGFHLLGWLLLLTVVAPSLTSQRTAKLTIPLPRQVGGLLLAPLVATGGLALLAQYVNVQALGSIQVGGAVAAWFLLAGVGWLGSLARLARPTGRTLGLGVAVFAILWIAFGAMAQVVWLQWWLIPVRFRLWLPLAIACLPWFLASGMVQQGVGTSTRIAWWLGQSVGLIGGFLLTLQLLPQLGFIVLLLPLFPPLIGILSWVAGLIKDAWIYAIASALFFGWILAAGFPLSMG